MSKEAMRAEADRLIKEAMEQQGHHHQAGRHPDRGDLRQVRREKSRLGGAGAASRAVHLQGMRAQAVDAVGVTARRGAWPPRSPPSPPALHGSAPTVPGSGPSSRWRRSPAVSIEASIPSPASRPRASPGLAPRRFSSACSLKAWRCSAQRRGWPARLRSASGPAVAAAPSQPPDSDISLATRTKWACSFTASATSGHGARAGIRVASASRTNSRDSH